MKHHCASFVLKNPVSFTRRVCFSSLVTRGYIGAVELQLIIFSYHDYAIKTSMRIVSVYYVHIKDAIAKQSRKQPQQIQISLSLEP